MNDAVPVPTLWDADGAPETVYLAQSSPDGPDEGWVITSLDVGSWRPLEVGDRLVALDRNSPAEFLVEVVEVEATVHEVYYRLRKLAALDPADEPRLDNTRSWLRPL